MSSGAMPSHRLGVDVGGTLEELKEQCKAETGFDPPRTPRLAHWMGRAGKAAV